MEERPRVCVCVSGRTVGGSLGLLYHRGSASEIQFATVPTVNFFANFINAAKMSSCADAVMLCERGLEKAVAYGRGRLLNYRFIFRPGLIKHYSVLISASTALYLSHQNVQTTRGATRV